MKEAPLVRKPELGSSPQRSTPGNGGRRSQTPFDNKQPSFWKRFWKWTGVFSLVSVAALFAYFNFTAHGRKTGAVLSEYGPAVFEAKTNPNLVFERAGSDVVNILLIGRDVNWTIKKVYDPTRKLWANMQVHDETTPARSDTMLIVSLDRNRKTIHMISLPRDARVRLPENKFGVRRAKLNAAHAYGGPEMLRQTIHDELGITIHHYAVIKFEGFKKLIDQVGGVEVDVIGALHRNGTRGNLKYDDNWGNLHIDLKPGKQILDGEKAHAYVRFRMDIEGDPGRIKRQQQVMRALAKKLTTQPLWNIAPLVQEIRKQFITDQEFDAGQMASAADFAKNLGDPSKIQPLTLFGVYGTRGSLILNEPKNKKLLQYIFGPTFNEDAFLQRSPSTENDEMGEENNSSPGARAILIKAGIIKGKPGEIAPEEADAESSDASESEVENSGSSRSSSRLAVAEESSSTPLETERPRRRVRREESTREEESTRAETTPRRRSRRERAAESESSSSRETRRPRLELSTPGDENSSSASRSSAPDGDEIASDESPVPVPEGLSTPDASDSPVPEAG